jgi:hypothetical protein
MDELTNWPKESDIYKVVQMDVDNQPCVRFGDIDSYHKAIVDKFISIYEHNFRILGTGSARVNIKKRKLYFMDEVPYTILKLIRNN